MFIHILRNPYSNIVSIRKYLGRKGKYPFLKKPIQSLYNSYYYMYKNYKLFPQKYLILKYEDLVLAPEKIMKKISNFLNIIFMDLLLYPTQAGKDWGGNSTSNVRFSGIDSI